MPHHHHRDYEEDDSDFDQYRDSEDESEEVQEFDSEEIVDQFEKAMEMLRHHSHGFNLEHYGYNGWLKNI